MDLLKLLAAFCYMFVHCASDQVHLHGQSDAKYGTASSSSLPIARKLKLSEEATEAVLVKGIADKNVVPDNNNLKNIDGASSGNNLTQHKRQENAMHAKEKGEWREGSKESEYFTMDYPWVRRRRPIHNKQVPFVP